MIEKLLKLVTDQNKLAPPKDELSDLFSAYLKSNEIDELGLEQVTAARLDNRQPYKSDSEPKL